MDSDQKQKIGERLRLAREQAGLSQGQVAKMLNLHRPTITEIEAGRRKVSAPEASQFAEIYGVSLDWLLNGSEQDDPSIQLAARELSRLSKQDLDTVLRLLKTLRKTKT